MTGVCRNLLACEPIKRALKKRTLIEPHLGHVVCPHAGTNLGQMVYKEFDEDDLRSNYGECFD